MASRVRGGPSRGAAPGSHYAVAVDTPLYLLLGLLIVALIIAGPLLKRWLNRRVSEAGDAAGNRFAAAQLVKTLGEFGTTLVIHAPEPLARQIVASATSNTLKDFAIRNDGGYGIRFVEPDDTIIRLVPDPEGTRMQVETFREYMGFPQTAPLWIDLRARVASAAGAREISVAEGAAVEYLRGELIDDRNARWERDV